MAFEVKDLFGLGEPIKKLFEVVSKGAGLLYKPKDIKREADAEAYKINAIAEAIANSQGKVGQIEYASGNLKLLSLQPKEVTPDMGLSERTQARVEYQQAKQQQNIEQIVGKAAGMLSAESEVSKESVDEDWATRFFSYAQDVSDEEVQNLWAKILAGEVKQPKSVSLRALELIRSLAKEDAETFLRAAKLKVVQNGEPFVLKENMVEMIGSRLGLDADLLLVELNLFQSQAALSLYFDDFGTPDVVYFEVGNYLVRATKIPNVPHGRLYLVAFTKIGKSILSLVSETPDESYVQALVKKLRELNFKVEYVMILRREGTIYHFDDPWLEFEF